MTPVLKIALTGLLILLPTLAMSAGHETVSPSTSAAQATRAAQAGKMAFSQPVAGLSPDQRLDFKVGRGLFRRLWVTAPASTQAADGLGPLYNARACMNCHRNNGRGHPPEAGDSNAISLLLRIDIPPQDEGQRQHLAEHRISNIPEPTYGLQLQDFAIPGHKSEYRLTVSYQEVPIALADGSQVKLRKPTYGVSDLGYGPLHPQARLSPRVAPQLIGLGLLDAIEDEAILARADPGDRDGDGISGRANRVWDQANATVALGRFGHKAGMPSVDQQSQAAFSTDLGMAVPLYPDATGDCTQRQAACRAAPNGNSARYNNLETHQQVTDLVDLYVSHVGVPDRRDIDHPDVRAGQQLFEQIGCAACHTPTYRTGSRTAFVANHGRDIAPYTDLLLHDMGEGLADHRPEGLANGREWRTAPLWGIGLTAQVSGQVSYLHDGRARSLLEAILWHGGEAQTQRDAVIALDQRSREQLLAFIESL